jgi:PHP family Zn ribbon phosphoesterase
MTPYNLVNMAALLGLDIIALTDHNSAGNCRAAIEAGREAGITVVPGMELNTAEEIHAVCLFPDIDSAEAFSAYVRSTLTVRNDPEAFGRQTLMDARDSVLGEEELLLIAASGIGIDALPGLIREYGGYCWPAHVDRASYSIISAFGMIDESMGYACAEVSDSGDARGLAAKHPALGRMRIIRSSDAHCLEDMRGAVDYIHPEENSAEALIAHLRQKYK